ncbi:hypothetical protein G7035_27080 (plasmid) [Paenibacillus polymyxa]|uniref:hypothetical protein n=1 Tax=Paenibacillus polymyxa TaxID=1406 RepID=UPI0002EB0CB4|nr:hypothetical protein [Paenibacillus polymyxa]QPK56324.1 hypothetical protein G7035_27080 [Paenibacillus polymyxa]
MFLQVAKKIATCFYKYGIHSWVGKEIRNDGALSDDLALVKELQVPNCQKIVCLAIGLLIC